MRELLDHQFRKLVNGLVFPIMNFHVKESPPGHLRQIGFKRPGGVDALFSGAVVNGFTYTSDAKTTKDHGPVSGVNQRGEQYPNTCNTEVAAV